MIIIYLYKYNKIKRASESIGNINIHHHKELGDSEEEISFRKKKSIDLLDFSGIQELLQVELHNFLKLQENNNSKFDENQDQNVVKNTEKNIEKNMEKNVKKNAEKNSDKNHENNHNNPETTVRTLPSRRHVDNKPPPEAVASSSKAEILTKIDPPKKALDTSAR